MKTHFILSMGTSILGNYRRESKGKTPGVSFPTLLHTQSKFAKGAFPTPGIFCGDYPEIRDLLLSEAVKGAEQTTIEYVTKEKNLDLADGHYHIIATDTSDCLFCAALLGHEVLKDADLDFYVPPGLGNADDDRFRNRGLPNLLAVLAEILDHVEAEGDEAMIIPTGGYKIMVPYLTIASILYKQPAYYIFEGSRSLIQLPAPPLGIDTAEFRTVIVLLDNVIGLRLEDAIPYYQALPPGFQRLVYADENGLLQYTAFGLRLKRMYRRETGISPFMLRASDNSLMPFLGTHRDAFSRMARLGETVWTGDKAPKMADHARHHHTNLFAYTELILLPILRDRPDFLSPEELFLLLGMVYLHDCGHSLSSFPVKGQTAIPLLPTEIRNFHNILGFIRLRSPEFSNTLKRQGLDIDPETLNNIAWLSVYHRKKMPLLAGECRVPGGYCFGPLAEKDNLIQSGKKIKGERLALLLSLFRIIDGMDKQVGRAGDAVEISMKAEAILADLPHLWDRVGRMQQVMSAKGMKTAGKIVETVLDAIVKAYGLQEQAGANSQDISGKTVPSCCGCLENDCSFQLRSPKPFDEKPLFTELEFALEKKKLGHRLFPAWEYLASRAQFFFEALQPAYYYSDLLLGMPRVTHCLENGKRRITINYPANDDLPGAREKVSGAWNEIRNWVAENLPPEAGERHILNASLDDPENIVGGILKEYCSDKNSEVAEILDKAGISVQFQYMARPVGCMQTKDKTND